MNWFSHSYHGQRYCSCMVESRNMAAILQNNGLIETCSLGLPCTSLILDIHVMINWHLPKQGICWPVSHDHIVGSSLQLIDVTCFFEVDRWPYAGFRLDSGLIQLYQVNLLKKVQGSDCRIPRPSHSMCRCALKNEVYNNRCYCYSIRCK